MTISDNAAVSEFLKASQAALDARWGNQITTETLREQDRDTAEWLKLSDEATRRYRVCMQEAMAADVSNEASQSRQLGGDVVGAWMGGIGAIPDAAWSGRKGGGQMAFTELAALAIKRQQQIASTGLRLDAARQLVGLLLTGRAPPGNLPDRLWQGVDLVNDLRGEIVPPWSVLATTLAINAIHAIADDSMSQFDQAMSQFDAVTIGARLSDGIDAANQKYFALSQYQVQLGQAADVGNGLDSVVQQMADIARDAEVQLERERAARQRVTTPSPSLSPPTPQYSGGPQYSPTTGPQRSQEDLQLERHLACLAEINRRVQAGDNLAGFDAPKCDFVR